MSNVAPLLIDIFAEDHAHEAFIRAMVNRIGREQNINLSLRLRNGRGGHGRAISELKLFQKAVLAQSHESVDIPDMIIVGIDSNCKRFTQASKEIQNNLKLEFADRTVIACPDPHIEKWYLADSESFYEIIGKQPRNIKAKCERDVYKGLLAETISMAGHPLTLGGVEFAEELVNAMDFYRAGRKDPSLQAFINELTSQIKLIQG
jgi:hypothetical protein